MFRKGERGDQVEIRVAMSQIFGLPVCLGDAEFGIAVREQPSGGSRAPSDFCEALAPWAWQAASAVALLAGFGQAKRRASALRLAQHCNGPQDEAPSGAGALVWSGFNPAAGGGV